VTELQRLVAGNSRVRALGTGHSFSRLADTSGDLISVAGLPPLVEIDTAGAAVTVGGGLRYSDITGPLHAAGRALRNLGSLPHISVAGACATGTHGSGVANGNLATAVSALEMVTADGDVVTVSRDAPGGEARARLRRFNGPVARGGERRQAFDQLARGFGDRVDGVLEDFGVGLRRALKAADLAHVLQRGRLDLGLGRGGLEVVKGSDVATHVLRVPPTRLHARPRAPPPLASTTHEGRLRQRRRS